MMAWAMASSARGTFWNPNPTVNRRASIHVRMVITGEAKQSTILGRRATSGRLAMTMADGFVWRVEGEFLWRWIDAAIPEKIG